MNTPDDRDLKDAFEALGTRVRANAPTFVDLASREALSAARSRHRRRQAAILVAVLAIPSVFILNARNDPAVDYERFTALTGLDLGEVTWRAPSDVLLEFPGREFLSRLPIIETALPAFAPDSVPSVDSNDSQRRSGT